MSRYDGQSFKTFRITDAPHRTVEKVVSLNKDYLLLRSEQTLFLFDKQRERFLPLWNEERNQTVAFTRFVATSDGHCWGITGSALSEMDLAEASFGKIRPSSICNRQRRPIRHVNFCHFVSARMGKVFIVSAREEQSVVMTAQPGG